jgi:hypothetical protein
MCKTQINNGGSNPEDTKSSLERNNGTINLKVSFLRKSLSPVVETGKMIINMRMTRLN